MCLRGDVNFTGDGSSALSRAVADWCGVHSIQVACPQMDQSLIHSFVSPKRSGFVPAQRYDATRFHFMFSRKGKDRDLSLVL